MDDLLGGSLGVRAPGRTDRKRPRIALRAVLATIPFVAITALQLVLGDSKALAVLSIWGALYFAAVVALTQRTSEWVENTMCTLVAPAMSEACAQSALRRMKVDFHRTRRNSLLAALIFLGLSLVVLRDYPRLPLLLWALGYFGLYLTAALVTTTTPFYLCIGSAIAKHPEQLFRLDPANSPLILASRRVGTHILGYWFLVFLLVVTLAAVPFAARQLDVTDVSALQTFVYAAIAVAGFFSFVFGSLVYLRFESDLRSAVDHIRLGELATLQTACSGSFTAANSTESEGELERLMKACDVLKAGGLTRTAGRTLAAATVAGLPAVAAIAAAVVALVGAE